MRWPIHNAKNSVCYLQNINKVFISIYIIYVDPSKTLTKTVITT